MLNLETLPQASPEKIAAPSPLENKSTAELALIGMLHDMRNIMSRLECSTSLLEPMILRSNSAQFQEMWELHRRSVQHLYEMTNRLLGIAWDNDCHLVNAPVGPLVEKICRACRDMLHHAHVELEWSIQENCPSVALHTDALSRALHALIENAMESCWESGVGRVIVRLSLEHKPERLFISVADNGSGITPDLRDRIFQPSFSTKGSTGLGLSLARKIIEGHGGEITVASIPGRTVFKIILPVV